jgi:hypothetical protein
VAADEALPTAAEVRARFRNLHQHHDVSQGVVVHRDRSGRRRRSCRHVQLGQLPAQWLLTAPAATVRESSSLDLGVGDEAIRQHELADTELVGQVHLG